MSEYTRERRHALIAAYATLEAERDAIRAELARAVERYTAAEVERDALAARVAAERKAAERIAIRAREALAGEIDADDALRIIIDLTGI